jgi:hypothetical protein
MVDAQRGDAAGGGPGEDIGGVQTPAKPDLDHAGVGRGFGKGQQQGGGGHLEEAGGEIRAQTLGGIQHALQKIGQGFVGNQLTRDADAFVVAHQMRLGGAVDAQALRLQHGAQIGAGAALAIGARDMEHGGRRCCGSPSAASSASITSRPRRPSGRLSAPSRASCAATPG